MHDVLIAGAGPAGAIAALVLARAGVRVTVFDRATFPRDKLCGDTLNPGALTILRRLGIAHVAQGGLPIDGMIVTGEPNVRVEARYGAAIVGRAMTRRVLDVALLEAAAHAGAQITEGVVIRGPIVEETGGERRVCGLEVVAPHGNVAHVRAGLVIAADGAHSRIARALRLARNSPRPRRWAVGAYFENVADLSSCGEMHVRRGHYIGVAPLPGGITNVCVVTAALASLNRPGDLLAARLANDPQLAQRFATARMMSTPVVMGPLAVDCIVPGTRGLLLAGDAAGFIDPMTGDGLRFALRGAELAAAEALHTLQHGNSDAHWRLQLARQREFRRKWRFNRSLRALVGAPLAVRTAASAAELAPVWLRHAIRYAGDLRAS